VWAMCCVTEPRSRAAVRLDIFIEILLGTWVNRVRTTCFGPLAPHEKKRALVTRQCGYGGGSPQSPGGGVLSQAMPLSVILKTVAPTKVALGLGSM
jgi:hypothetical protein